MLLSSVVYKAIKIKFQSSLYSENAINVINNKAKSH